MAATLPALDRGPVALRRLRREYERAVERAVSAAAGGASASERVALVVSPRLSTLLSHVFVDGLDALARSGVAECVGLADDVARIAGERVVYLSFAGAEAVRDVAVHAVTLLEHRRAQSAGAPDLHLLAAGKWTAMGSQVLEGYGVSELFRVGALPLGLIPLDSDLLTLGLDRCLYDCGVRGDASCLADVAAAIDLLQRTYGRFEQVKYKGELSMQVLSHLVELHAAGRPAADGPSTDRATAGATAAAGAGARTSRLHTLVMLDRGVDYASALSTPLTYEALLDEVVGIQDGFLPAFALAPADASGNNASEPAAGAAPIALNSSDGVFAEIRSMHIHTVAPRLKARATAMQEAYASFQQKSPSASAEEVQAFVKGVPSLKAAQRQLERHVDLLEAVEAVTTSKPFRDTWQLERAILDAADGALEAVEALVLRHDPLLKVLRLLCLYSVVNAGLDRRDLERVKLGLVRAYGHELVFSFDSLARLGLLTERAPAGSSAPAPARAHDASAFRYVAQQLGAIDVDVDVQQPESAAFVTGGYLPISCRLLEEVLRSGDWRAADGAMARLPGPRAELRLSAAAGDKPRRMKRPVVVLLLVGGASYLEVAALRWTASFYPVELLIAATSVESGGAFVGKALEHLPLATR